MFKRTACISIAIIGSIAMPLMHGQDKAARLTFDVASIRPSQTAGRNGSIRPLPEGRGYAAQNIPIKLMISLMYKVPMRQISGGPDWLDTDRYDVEARTDRSYDIDDLHAMFQNLLAERFNLKFHKVVKDGPVYVLTVDKSGLKMKADDREQDFKIPINPGGDGFVGARVPMSYLCWWLGQQLQRYGRPVIDKTGLDRNYDFTLSFAPELPPDASKENLPPELLDRPSIFDAVRDQLGLKLQAQKGPVAEYVIDHIERPSPN